MIAIGELTEQDIESKMKMGLKEVKPKTEEWRNPGRRQRRRKRP